jgi:hypothetical protein
MGILEELFKKKSLVILPMTLSLLFGCAYAPINKDFKKKKVEPSKTEAPSYDFKDFIKALGKRNFINNEKAKRGIEFLKKVQGLIEKKNLKLEMDLNNGKLRKEDLEIICKNFPKKEEINKNTFYDFKFVVGNDSLDKIPKYFGYSGNENKFFEHNPNLKSKLKEGGTINVRAHESYLNGYTNNIDENREKVKRISGKKLREDANFFGCKFFLENILGIKRGKVAHPRQRMTNIRNQYGVLLDVAKEYCKKTSYSSEEFALYLAAIAKQESGGKLFAASRKNALGPFQIMVLHLNNSHNPFTWRGGANLAGNILKKHIIGHNKKLGKDDALYIALAEYNLGERIYNAIEEVEKQGKPLTAKNILFVKGENGSFVVPEETRNYPYLVLNGLKEIKIDYNRNKNRL